ncbi:MAG: peptidoglycan DD-metalloendopeptidase family protein [Syntrophotaleaceae bacterium]
MTGKKISVIIIPEGSRTVRRFCLRPDWLKLAAAGTIFFLLAVSVLVFDYCRINVDRAELMRLRGMNRQQREEVRTLAATLENLRREMVVLQQNDARVRLLARLDGPPDDAMIGIGGPSESDPTTNLSDLQRQIDEIRQAIDLRRESLDEIQGYFNDQRSLLAAKPKGWPTKGWMTSGFGRRKSPFTGERKMHYGLDIAARTGTSVTAAANGIVSKVATLPDYGKMVIIDHGYGYQTCYGHNSKILVKVGQRVKRGERIAEVGNTGRSTGSHLHYEVRLNGVPVNPRTYL